MGKSGFSGRVHLHELLRKLLMISHRSLTKIGRLCLNGEKLASGW